MRVNVRIHRRTLGGHRLFVLGTAEQPGAVENLVHDDGEAVHVSFLSSGRQSDGSRLLRRHQFRRRPQKRWKTKRRDVSHNQFCSVP